MAKPKRLPASQTNTPSAGDGFTTFSIRLNEQQRDRLVEAAALKGWTPTQLVRTAALERAAAICNTVLPRNFDYKGLASELANRWFAESWVDRPIDEDEWRDIQSGDPNAGNLSTRVPPLPMGVVFKLKKAATEGGTEFLNLLVDFAEGLTAAQRSDLPAPIDPKKLIGGEE